MFYEKEREREKRDMIVPYGRFVWVPAMAESWVSITVVLR